MFYSKTGCCLSHCPHMAGDSDQRLYGRQSRKGSTKAKTSLHGRTVALRVIAEINQGKILDALIAATGQFQNQYISHSENVKAIKVDFSASVRAEQTLAQRLRARYNPNDVNAP